MIVQKDDSVVVDEQASEMQLPDQSKMVAQVQLIDDKAIKGAIDTLKKYKTGKESLEERIVENEQWYKLRHWEVMRNKYNSGTSSNKVEPSSAWLFNAIANKHADAMDNFPEPNVLPREEGDAADADILSAIVPVILEARDFEGVYSDNWWYKLKMGAACYGVFWDSSLENGLGDIVPKKIDLLNIFWEPGITDIQKSRNLFIVDLVDNDILKGSYPDKIKDKTNGKVIDIKEYVFDDTIDTKDKSLVVDWYYKKLVNGKTLLHYVKFVGDTLLYASEDDPTKVDTGWYEHGLYPVVIDVLHPEEGTPVGFGYIDIAKDPQMYIDKLNQIIIENALQAGKNRYFVKDQANFNLDEYSDMSKDFVFVSGQIDEASIRKIEVKQLDGNLVNLMQYKVDELKETSGNRDVNQGSAGGGVTAAAAIAALQEAGNKLSRDMIKGAYRAYTKLNYLVIENIRQFYSFDRTFRIEGEKGIMRYIQYSNANIANQILPPTMEGEEPASRKPVFDIKIKAQRTNPFSRMSQNELAKELYGAGMFNPQIADQSLIAIEMMDFEGKEAIIEKIVMNKQKYDMQQAQIAQMQMMMGAAQGGALGNIAEQKVPNKQQEQGSIPTEAGVRGAVRNGQTGYGERLAANATPRVEG